MGGHIVAIDQGTTSTRAIVFNDAQQIAGVAQQEFAQHFPRSGWVEHEPEDLWQTTAETVRQALANAGLAASDIAAIGITNQRETTLVWNRKTGEPVYRAIVWQDRRTADLCARLKAEGNEAAFTATTGLLIDPYFSATKVAWILDEVEGARAAAEAGDLIFGTVDSWLIWKLSGGRRHVTDATNACRTLLYDIRKQAWADDILKALNIPATMLPEVLDCDAEFGTTEPGLFGAELPILGVAGDQQAALFGQACFEPGDAKCTYGTGAFILMNTGSEPVASRSGLITTVGWRLGAGAEAGEVCYALEGSAFIAGAVVQWLRDGLEFFASAPEIEELARSVEDSGGVILVPALTGLGAPHWRPDARGIITGITRGTTRGHMARAALEGIALQNYDILKAMERDSDRQLKVLKVDGGASANDLLMQFQSDVLGVAISRPEIVETTALGAAFLAGLATGVWHSKAEITSAWREQRRFEPNPDRAAVDDHLARWDEAVGKA